ncbi:MAG: hypothetical protein AAF432_16770 [Planctomycetota bacterium]
MPESHEVAGRSVLACLLLPAIGVVCAYLLLRVAVLPTIGYGYAERLIAIGERLDTSMADQPTAIFLGSSVVVEGIDASIVEDAAPGWRALNFAINGCEINEQRVMLDKVVAAQPRAVVLNLRPITMAMPGDIPAEKAYGYALGGFPLSWRDDFTTEANLPLISEESLDRLTSSEFEAQLHFRRAPIQAMNDRVRRVVRRGLRSVPPDEFALPNEMSDAISGSTLDKHIGDIIDENIERTASYPLPYGRELQFAIDTMIDAGVTPVLVITPQHPDVAPAIAEQTAALTSFVRVIGDNTGSVVLDAHDLVGAEGFADALHLGTSGRAALSEAIARVLSDLPESES